MDTNKQQSMGGSPIRRGLFFGGRGAGSAWLMGAIGSIALAQAPLAQASCGASFCSVNTGWDVQGVWNEPGLRLDLRQEYVAQERLRRGGDSVDPDQVVGHHVETDTLNKNLVVGLDYAFNDAWGVGLTVPVVGRDHAHVHFHHGARLIETWDFTRLGDARVLGRYQFAADPEATRRSGVKFGVKLPTGQHDVGNDEGDVAERSLQPGTGSTDLILGAYASDHWGEGPYAWFVQGTVQSAVASQDDFRPGNQFGLEFGISRRLGASLHAAVQLNLLVKGRDGGAEGEPEDSGGTYLHLSPGLRWDLGRSTGLYGFVQLPLYQYVNGVQLTADWSGVVGISHQF